MNQTRFFKPWKFYPIKNHRYIKKPAYVNLLARQKTCA